MATSTEQARAFDRAGIKLNADTRKAYDAGFRAGLESTARLVNKTPAGSKVSATASATATATVEEIAAANDKLVKLRRAHGHVGGLMFLRLRHAEMAKLLGY